MTGFRLSVVRVISRLIPETRGFGVKRSLYRWAGVKVGKGVRINSSAIVLGSGELSIGDNTWVGPEVMIVCSSLISIGANCDIAPRVYIGDGTHLISPMMDHVAGKGAVKPIRIGNGCWLCVNSTILPGVTIGEKCIVAAGAVVNKDSGAMQLLAGVPAKTIKSIE